MPQQIIRFGVSDGKLRAATWKVWTPSKSVDVYLACRAIGGQLKTSLHESGKWHVAYSQEFFERNILNPSKPQSEQNRFVQRWSRPAPLINGATLAYRILTPHLSVNKQITGQQGDLDSQLSGWAGD